MNGYKLMKQWEEWLFDNPHKGGPVHTALFLAILTKWNRAGWRFDFALDTEWAMEFVRVKRKHTFFAALDDLHQWGVISITQKAKNQHASTLIYGLFCQSAVTLNDTATDTATVTATDTATDTATHFPPYIVLKPINNKTNTSYISIEKEAAVAAIDIKKSNFKVPSLEEIQEYALQANLPPEESAKFNDYRTTTNWHIGRTKITDWRAAFRTWCANTHKNENNNPQTYQQLEQAERMRTAAWLTADHAATAAAERAEHDAIRHQDEWIEVVYDSRTGEELEHIIRRRGDQVEENRDDSDRDYTGLF